MSITEFFSNYKKIFIQKAKIRSFFLIRLLQQNNKNNKCSNFDLDLGLDERLRNLENLNLYGIGLTKIDSNSFQHLTNLKKLEIFYNEKTVRRVILLFLMMIIINLYYFIYMY